MKLIVKQYMHMSEEEAEELYEELDKVISDFKEGTLQMLIDMYPAQQWTERTRKITIKKLQEIQQMVLAIDSKRLL
jgi:hypothetical protein